MDMNMGVHAACIWSVKVSWVTMQSQDSIIVKGLASTYNVTTCHNAENCTLNGHCHKVFGVRPRRYVKTETKPSIKKSTCSVTFLKDTITIYTSVSQPVVLDEQPESDVTYQK
jgi:hypothetical protein